MYRVGLGSDSHRFETGRPLMLGGVKVESPKGLAGHSDADVVLHALCDALLGAAALGDLGEHFPGDDKNKNRPSTEILHEVANKVWDKGFHVVNVDVVITAEEPKLTKYKERMQHHIATVLNVDKSFIGIKATTNDGLGSLGRGEGIQAQAVVLLKVRED